MELKLTTTIPQRGHFKNGERLNNLFKFLQSLPAWGGRDSGPLVSFVCFNKINAYPPKNFYAVGDTVSYLKIIDT